MHVSSTGIVRPLPTLLLVSRLIAGGYERIMHPTCIVYHCKDGPSLIGHQLRTHAASAPLARSINATGLDIAKHDNAQDDVSNARVGDLLFSFYAILCILTSAVLSRGMHARQGV